MSAKIQEGLEHIKSAEKYLKTSVLKWFPDYDSAADEYDQAAKCFRVAKVIDKTRECHLLASKCYKSNKSFFHAAKSIETAIIVSKDVTPPEEIFKRAQEACSLYQQHGSGDAGANVLDKAAGIILKSAPELALQLYRQAADVSAVESVNHQATEYMAHASRILVRLGKYDEAVDSLRREIAYHQELQSFRPIGRLTVAMVLVQLARGDAVAAEKVYKEWGSHCEDPEAQTLEQLIAAFDDEDPDAARDALNSPFIKHMDVEYAKLAMSIPLPKGMSLGQKSTVRENAAASYVSQNVDRVGDQESTPAPSGPYSEPSNKTEEEEGGGLC